MEIRNRGKEIKALLKESIKTEKAHVMIDGKICEVFFNSSCLGKTISEFHPNSYDKNELLMNIKNVVEASVWQKRSDVCGEGKHQDALYFHYLLYTGNGINYYINIKELKNNNGYKFYCITDKIKNR